MTSSTSKKNLRPKQAGKPRMGRPAREANYAALAEQTRTLMRAIKEGSGNLSNQEIANGLKIGKDSEGHFHASYITKYMNVSNGKSGAALSPDRLSQTAEKARLLGWLPDSKKQGPITIPHRFKHLEIPDGELLSEHIRVIRHEREVLLKAQLDAVLALTHLIASMKSCRKMGFTYVHTEEIDGEEVDVGFEGVNADLAGVLVAVSSAIVSTQYYDLTTGLF